MAFIVLLGSLYYPGPGLLTCSPFVKKEGRRSEELLKEGLSLLCDLFGPIKFGIKYVAFFVILWSASSLEKRLTEEPKNWNFYGLGSWVANEESSGLYWPGAGAGDLKFIFFLRSTIY